MKNRTERTPGPTSARLIAGVGGDADAIGWLVERFSPLLLFHARRRLGPELSRLFPPEDVIHDVWVSVLPKLADYRLHGVRFAPRFTRFLGKCLYNHCANLLRAHVAGRLRRASLDSQSESAVPIAATRETVGRAIRDERGRHVLDALGSLDDADQEVLTLRVLEGWPYVEVAVELEVSVDAAKKRVRRALTRLRRRLPRTILAEIAEELGLGQG